MNFVTAQYPDLELIIAWHLLPEFRLRSIDLLERCVPHRHYVLLALRHSVVQEHHRIELHHRHSRHQLYTHLRSTGSNLSLYILLNHLSRLGTKMNPTQLQCSKLKLNYRMQLKDRRKDWEPIQISTYQDFITYFLRIVQVILHYKHLNTS